MVGSCGFVCFVFVILVVGLRGIGSGVRVEVVGARVE